MAAVTQPPCSAQDISGLGPAPPVAAEEQNAGLAQAVAALLSPMITAAVDRVIAAGITQLGKELGNQAKRLSELEHCLSDLKDEMQSSHTYEQQTRNTQQHIFKNQMTLKTALE